MSVIYMPQAVNVIYKKILATLKKEREIKKSDLDAIALLAQNIVYYQDANRTIDEHGFMITSTTEKGTTIKQNPACIAADNAQRMMVRLMEQLMMTPKSKVLADGRSELKEEEVDPIAAALLNLKKKREKNGT